MFAFALWDLKTQRLLLARDQFGKKPLFIADRPGALIFGSEIEPIVQFPGMERRFDSNALGHYLLNRYVPGPSTFFRDVKSYSRAITRLGRTAILSDAIFYCPVCHYRAGHSGLRRPVTMFAKTFDEAVRIRMRSDVRSEPIFPAASTLRHRLDHDGAKCSLRCAPSRLDFTKRNIRSLKTSTVAGNSRPITTNCRSSRRLHCRMARGGTAGARRSARHPTFRS